MKNMKTVAKLFVSFSIVFALAVVVGVVGMWGMYSIKNADDTLYEFNVVAISHMGEIREEVQRQRNYTRDLAIYAGEESKIQEIQQNIAKSEEAMNGFMVAYEATITNAADETEYFKAKDAYEKEYNEIKKGIAAACYVGPTEVMEILGSQSAASCIDTMVTGFTASMDNNNRWAKEQVDANTDLFRKMLLTEIVTLAAAAAIVVILVNYIAKLISKPLRTLTEFMVKAGSTGDVSLRPEDIENISHFSKNRDETGVCIASTAKFVQHIISISDELGQIADGDLTTVIDVLSDNDTMGMAMRKMTNNLNRMFGEINAAAKQVATASKQIADGSQTLAQGSTEQAAAAQQLSSSISEIAEKTKTNADMADKAAQLANAIMSSATKGNQQMDEMMGAVKEINAASQSISRVIKVIDDIAFQTNILALNAAVEAARAGQHGQGFAVVAEEVRSLAAKSAEAAKDTSGLIANSIQKAELGARIADDTAASLVEIVSGITKSNQLVDDIAKFSEEQSVSISQINKGIDQVAQVIQQNSATAEESAAASQQMSGQSSILEELIAQFKLQDSGQNYGQIGSFGAKYATQLASAPREKTYESNRSRGEYGKY